MKHQTRITDYFTCRNCYTVHQRQLHSQKECIKSTKAKIQSEIDKKFEPKEQQAEQQIERPNNNKIPAQSQPIVQPLSAPIFATPRTLRRRKIAPIQQWYGPAHRYQAKE